MNKISIIGFPLPVTSAILVYNLGFITPVAAQDSSLSDFSTSDNIYTQFYLNKNQLEFNSPQYRLANLDLSFLSRDTINQIGFSTINSDLDIIDLDLIPDLILETPSKPIVPLLAKENTPELESNLLATINQLDQTSDNASILESDRTTINQSINDSSITWNNFKVQADKSIISTFRGAEISENTSNLAVNQQPKLVNYVPEKTTLVAVAQLQKNSSPPTINSSTTDVTTESVVIPHNIKLASVSSTPETALIDNELNQTLKQIAQYKQRDIALDSFNKVSSLKDVQTTDWAYSALLRLVEEYGCLAGFEDNTFRGNRTITRYEFAAALSSCLQSIETIAAENQDNSSITTEVTELQKLQTEFAQELLTVQTETDNLEQRVAFLEDNNFSPTTILRGQVDFLIAGAFGDQKAVSSGETPSEDLANEITFSSRAQLNLETSFTGRDLLRTRIEGGTINAFGSGVTGTQMTFLGTSTSTDNDIVLRQLFYRFPLGDKGNAYIAGASQSASAFIPTLNRASTISLFGFNNPIFDLGFGTGGGVYYQFNDFVGAGVTYFSGSPSDPLPGKGFFNGDFSALGQITLTPADSLGIAFTYARFFSPEPGVTNNVTGFTGSTFAQLPFGGDTPTSSDNFNLSVSYQVSDRLELTGWIGYLTANAQSDPAVSGFIGFEDASADIWTGSISATYNDLGKLGSKLSMIVGVPPKLTSNDISEREDDDTSLHLELSYNYPLTEHISMIPGVLAITNPEHNSENNAIVVGLFQTSFSF